MGPFIDFVLRRVRHASAALEKTAMRQPAQNKPKKVKNVTHDAFGETIGRLHMERQDFDKLELKKNTKAWKADKRRRRGPEGVDEAADAGAGAGAGAVVAAGAATAVAAGAGGGAEGNRQAKRLRRASDDAA